MSYKLLDESTVKSAIKTYLKELIDKGFHSVEITEFNVDIQNIIEQSPNVDAVPLDVHERMKCELNSEINVYAAMAKSAVDKLELFWRNAIRLLLICGNMRNVTPASITAT